MELKFSDRNSERDLKPLSYLSKTLPHGLRSCWQHIADGLRVLQRRQRKQRESSNRYFWFSFDESAGKLEKSSWKLNRSLDFFMDAANLDYNQVSVRTKPVFREKYVEDLHEVWGFTHLSSYPSRLPFNFKEALKTDNSSHLTDDVYLLPERTLGQFLLSDNLSNTLDTSHLSIKPDRENSKCRHYIGLTAE